MLAASHRPGLSRQRAPTFTKDVAPIFYKNCTGCHRPGEIAPMSLLTYRTRGRMRASIATQVRKGTMPPWHADPAHGEFLNDRRLSAAEKDTILKWVSAGRPEGNAADLPAAPVYPDGWTIGKPDAVFAMAEDYPVPASGTIDYKYFEVPTNFTEDRWIQAYEVKPGTPRVVHHVIVYARPPRRAPAAAPPARTADAAAATPQPPFTFAPGMEEPDSGEGRAARQATPNDRPAPEGGTGAFVGGFTPGQAVRVYPAGHGDAAAGRLDAHLPDALHGERQAGDRSLEDRLRLREERAEAGSRSSPR